MAYLQFTLWFTVFHAAAYVVAGAIALAFSKDLYAEKGRVLDFLRDMDDPEESGHVQRTFLPAQVVRGVLMSLVLYPVLGPLGDMSVALRFVFLASLAFVYLEVASSIPFPTTVEGYVYLRDRYRGISGVWKLFFESILYSVLLAGPVAWLAF